MYRCECWEVQQRSTANNQQLVEEATTLEDEDSRYVSEEGGISQVEDGGEEVKEGGRVR